MSLEAAVILVLVAVICVGLVLNWLGVIDLSEPGL